MRKLSAALLALLVFLPIAGYPLGLGEIHLRSALNEPLNAEIELLSVNAGDADSLNVSLAPYDTFARLGVERTAALMNLKFAVEKDGHGGYMVKVTSREPIREPFLDFIVEVSWKSGRLLREYTLLLDPPNMVREQAPVVEAPKAQAAPARISPAAVSAAPSRGVRQPASASAEGASQGALTYGPVRKDDTLWTIAREIRPDTSVSVPQVMMALLKANPEAFYENNVNRLKAGQVLRIDDPSRITAMSKAAAAREILRQNNEWQDYKDQAARRGQHRPAAGVVPEHTAAVAGSGQPRLKLMVPEAQESAPESAPRSGGAVDKGNLEGLRKELVLATEATEAQRRENEDLRTRVQELEVQLAAMQRLLSLKDNDLALLQRQLRGGGEEQLPETSPVAEGSGESSPAEPKAEKAEPAPAAPAEAPKEEPVSAPATPAGQTVAPAPVAQAPEAAPKPAPAKPAQPKKAPLPPAQPGSLWVGILDDLMGNTMAVGALSVVGLSLVILGVLIIRRRRRGDGLQESILTGGTSSMLKAKASEGAPSEETSFLTDFAVSGMGDIEAEDSEVDPLTEADVYMAYGRYRQAEELLKEAIKDTPDRHELRVKLMEVYYATKDKDAFEANANDVFSATEGTGPLWSKVLSMGHELCPDNPLFNEAPGEVEGGNETAGLGEARPMEDVLDIGLDIDALTAEMEPEEASQGHGGVEEFSLDLGVDFSDLEEDADKEAKPQPEQDITEESGGSAESGLADHLESAQEREGEEIPQATETLAGGDEGAGMEAETEAAEPLASLGEEVSEASPEEKPHDDNSIDFDTDFTLPVSEEESEAETVEEAGTDTDEDHGALEFDLSGLGLGDEEEAETPSEQSQEDAPASAAELPQEADTELAAGLDFDALEMESLADEGTPDLGAFDLEGLDLTDSAVEEPATAVSDAALSEGSEAATEEDEALGEGDELFGDLDEIGTKLDLARAYIDMGDEEGARSILDEVSQEGNEEQKQQAAELLQQIA